MAHFRHRFVLCSEFSGKRFPNTCRNLTLVFDNVARTKNISNAMKLTKSWRSYCCWLRYLRVHLFEATRILHNLMFTAGAKLSTMCAMKQLSCAVKFPNADGPFQAIMSILFKPPVFNLIKHFTIIIYDSRVILTRKLPIIQLWPLK